jgi:hypothetical protein
MKGFPSSDGIGFLSSKTGTPGSVEVFFRIWCSREGLMATIGYKVARDGDQWSLSRDGKRGMSYLTQEAAFEVAISEAGGDLRSGHDIVIEVAAATDPAGARDRGGAPMEGDGFR